MFVAGAVWAREQDARKFSAEDQGSAASCHNCIGAGGYEDHDGSWVKCSCQREQDAREPSEPVRVQIAGRRSGKHSALADMIVERASARGVRVEFVEPDGEPSDAEVLAALNAYYGDYMLRPKTSLDDFRPPRTAKDMRTALLAAQAVRRG